VFVSGKPFKPWLERLARNKHNSLLRKFVNYGQKSFITFAPEEDSLFVWQDIGNYSLTGFEIRCHFYKRFLPVTYGQREIS
jgi:hypothetical protein